MMFFPFATQAAGCTSGQLVKGSSHSVYYCSADGKRYVFANLKTYNTWYPDFSTVVTISDTSLAAIPLGGNVTYKPGVRLVKITSDPKVYAVDAGGLLHAISSEAVASELYGSAWNRAVDDVPDAFFVNYHLGSDITSAFQFAKSTVVAAAANINVDKGLTAELPESSGVTLTLSPSLTTLASGQSTTVTVSVKDPAGILSASIFLNGNLLHTCSQFGSPVTATCSTTLYGGDYADGTQLSFYGQEVNRNAQRVVSSTKTIMTAGGSSSTSGSVSLSFSSDSTTLNAGQSTTVTVSANDPAGISSVSVFVNGTMAQNCNQSGIIANASCSVTLYGSNYPSGSTVTVYGQEVNKNGIPTISAVSNLSVAVGASTSGSATLSFTPNATTLQVGQTMTVQVAAYDTFGVSSLSVYVNGARVKNCSASGATAHATCSAIISGSSYTSGSAITVYGQASDTEGTSFVSPTSTITITPGAALSGNVSLSFSPYATTLASGLSTTVSVHAIDSSNVTSMSIYVNDVVVRTCTLPGTSTTATCSASISGSNYASGSTIAVYGVESNTDGASNTSSTSTLTVSSAAAGNGSVSLFVSPSATSISTTQTVTVTVNAYDPAGLGAVNIFVNGTDVHSCSQSGTWPTGASCTYAVSGSNYSAGTTLNIYGQGVNTLGTVTNSVTTSLGVH